MFSCRIKYDLISFFVLKLVDTEEQTQMIRRLIHTGLMILFLLQLAPKLAKGQMFPWSLQYVTNMNTINPAYVGMWDQAGFMFTTRTNWVGFPKTPLSQQVSWYSPIKDQKGSLGLNIKNMNIGREKQLFITGDYAYQVRMDVTHYLRFGLRAGIVNFDNNMTDYQLYPDRIPDLEFSTDVRLFFMTTVGVGAVFFNDDYFISLSMPQMINNTFKVNRSTYSSTQEFKTAYLSGGYVFKLPKSLRIRPNLLVIGTVGKPVYFDAAAVVYLPGDLQLGINLRSNGEVCFSGQYTLNNGLKIGYAADYALATDIRKYQLGTYEFVVGYEYNLYRKKYGKPSYF